MVRVFTNHINYNIISIREDTNRGVLFSLPLKLLKLSTHRSSMHMLRCVRHFDSAQYPARAGPRFSLLL
jgi:hypothetical protein